MCRKRSAEAPSSISPTADVPRCDCLVDRRYRAPPYTATAPSMEGSCWAPVSLGLGAVRSRALFRTRGLQSAIQSMRCTRLSRRHRRLPRSRRRPSLEPGGRSLDSGKEMGALDIPVILTRLGFDPDQSSGGAMSSRSGSARRYANAEPTPVTISRFVHVSCSGGATPRITSRLVSHLSVRALASTQASTAGQVWSAGLWSL